MKRTLQFAAACTALIGALWAILGLVMSGATARHAFSISAVTAFAVQVVAFLVAREMARRKNVMAGWGIGIALRFGALLIVGFIAVPRLGLPLSASLLSLAMFLFVTTLIEPLFLKT